MDKALTATEIKARMDTARRDFLLGLFEVFASSKIRNRKPTKTCQEIWDEG